MIDDNKVEQKRLEMLDRLKVAIEAKRVEQKCAEEPMYRYVVEFDCTPSTFEHIKNVIDTQRTFRRMFRYYEATKNNKGVVIKKWQNRT